MKKQYIEPEIVVQQFYGDIMIGVGSQDASLSDQAKPGYFGEWEDDEEDEEEY